MSVVERHSQIFVPIGVAPIDPHVLDLARERTPVADPFALKGRRRKSAWAILGRCFVAVFGIVRSRPIQSDPVETVLHPLGWQPGHLIMVGKPVRTWVATGSILPSRALPLPQMNGVGLRSAL